jgi:hypothetical protein
MRAALGRCREIEATDKVAAAMAPYLEQHIKEELHHDDWLLEDLETLGHSRATVLARMPPPTVARFIGAHYYWIHHFHPVAKLGQIAVMEGYPPSVDLVDLMVDRSGYPRRAFRTIEKHCHLDPNHRDDFDAAIDQMPLNDEHHAILRTSALHTIHSSARCFREVVLRAEWNGHLAGFIAGTHSSPGQPASRGFQVPIIPQRRRTLRVTRNVVEGSYRLEDHYRGSSFEVGERELFLLDHCDGLTSPDEICGAFREQFGESLTPDELEEFVNTARSEDLFVRI